MVIRVYVSGISGNKEVKKRQQRVLLILDSKNVNYEVIDIAEPGAEEAKDFVQNNATSLGGTISDPNPRHPLPPQIFNDDEYCGDYDQFDMANEIDEMEKFLKLQVPQAGDVISNAEIILKNGEVSPDEANASKEGDSVAADSEVKENTGATEEETIQSEEKSKDEDVKEAEEVEQTSEEAKANEDSKDEGDSKKEEESEVAEESKEPRNEVAEGGGDLIGEIEDGLVAKKDEEKADA